MLKVRIKNKLKRITKKRLVTLMAIFVILGISLVSIYRLYAAFVNSSDYTESSLGDTTVYVNSLDQDKNYYLGLNYTNITSTSLPTGVNQNLYNEDNLVPVTINYDGTDINDSTLVGKVSPTENYSKYTYYKYYPLKDGKIEIELPDNLFSLRPKGKGFEGWATNYSGTVLRLDRTTYTRYATVPVVSASTPIEITFHAIWGPADYQVGGTGLIDNFKPYMMVRKQSKILGTQADIQPGVTYNYDFDPDTTYLEQITITPTNPGGMNFTGYYNEYGAYYYGTYNCRRNRTCTYYARTSDVDYNPSKTYYYLVQNGTGFSVYQVTNANLRPILGFDPIDNGTNMIGYFYKKDINNDDASLYYDASGINCSEAASSCTSNNTYKLVQVGDTEASYYGDSVDEDNNVIPGLNPGDYYYLVTRDTNILVLTSNANANAVTSNNGQPFTVTASNQSANSNNTNIGTSRINGGYRLIANSDMTIENINFGYSAPRGTAENSDSIGTTDNGIYANFYNFKIGRNVKHNTNANTRIGEGFFGGDTDSDTESSYRKFKVIIESGVFRYFVGGGAQAKNYYLYEKVILGSDFDIANDNDDSKLRFYFSTISVYRGNLRTEDLTKSNVSFVVKSGRYGKSSSNQYDANYDRGIYVGCRGYADDYGLKTMKVEGGDINVINGGPGNDSSVEGKNVIHISITGGTVRSVFGGAGRSPAYGNRIIQVTGGTVKNNVFGGSNSSSNDASDDDGKLFGDTFLYFGGNATIGGGTTLFNAAPGDVFGAGNGKNGDSYRELGTIASTHIVVEGGVDIKGNLYGGGNYGTTGRATASEFTTTKIELLGGTVEGDVYGSSNSNGSGKKSVKEESQNANVYYYMGYKTFDQNEVIPTTTTYTKWVDNSSQTYTYENYHFNNTLVQDGDVCDANSPSWNANESKCYIAYQVIKPGEPDDKYSVCPSWCAYYMQSLDSVAYVAGEWHKIHDTSISFGEEAHAITINQKGSTVKGNIYGGANSKGTVFASVTINLEGGSVGDSVFAGGRGAGTYVSANMDVEIDGFDDEDVKVYGGSAYGAIGYTDEDNDANTVKHTVVVNMNSGKVGTIFGGSMGTASNQANAIKPLVASVVTVNINGGEVTEVYGGNDLNGEYVSSPTVNLLGGTITSVFGGSNRTGMDVPSVVNVNGSTATEVFGGSNKLGETKSNYVNVISGTVTNVYGGNNEGGTAINPSVILTGGTVTNAYGCGKGEGTSCEAPRLWVHGYNNSSTTVYGGGAKASVTKASSVLIDSGTVGTIFGGSNELGTVVKSNVHLSNGTVTNAYGGNNAGGQTNKTYVELGGANVTNVYGGGDDAFTKTTKVYTYSGTATNVFGGGHMAGATDTNVEIYGGNITNVYGGSNENGTVADTNVWLKNKGTAPTKDYNVVYHNAITYPDVNTINMKSVFTDLQDVNVTWTSSDTDVATINGDSATIVGTGETILTTTKDDKTYKYYLDVDDSIVYPDEKNIIGGGQNNGDEPSSPTPINDGWTSNYQYKDMTVDVTVTGKNYNMWCDASNDDCLGYTYQEDVYVKVNNPYNTQVLNYNLLLIGSSPFVAPESIQHYPKVEFSQYKPSILKTTGYYYSGQSWCNPQYNCQIPLNANGTTDLGHFRIFFNDRDFQLIGDFEENVSPRVIAQASNGGTGGNNDYYTYIYSRDMYNIPNYQVADRNVTNVFGGNNAGGLSQNTHVNVLDEATADTLYGGGNEAQSNNTNVYLENGTIQTLYGGGNGSGAVVNDSTSTIITGGVVNSSAYGGGNKAIVKKQSEISLIGGTINGSLFAAGNQAVTGDAETNTGKSIVNVLAGTVSTNVYGGANTSVVNGETFVNIGDNAISNNDLKKYDYEHIISIGDPNDHGTAMAPKGTIFGGGEANASGSSNYDFSFVSVTVGTNVNIDGTGYYGKETSPISGVEINKSINTYGSFFGSGNASEIASDGYSKITIKNYGTSAKPATNVSIQRARETKIISSHVQLLGTTDRTNDWGEIDFTFSNTDSVYILDGTELYLQASGNLLKNLYSGTYNNDTFAKEEVVINDDGVITDQNVNNKIFILSGKHLDVATNQNVTAFGNVNGMAFMGIYKPNNDGTVSTGMYKDSYQTGQTADGADVTVVSGGTYIRGKHYKDNDGVSTHDIKVDGYYSHYVNDSNVISIEYVVPTPENADDYTWAIGVNVYEFEVNMTASKFSTMGTAELLLSFFEKPNTEFQVTGFSYEGLNDEINLVNKNQIPKVAATDDDADNNFALIMGSSDSGWSANSKMSFFTDPDHNRAGDEYYYADNTNTTPSLLFYLYHSKNIATVGDIGSVNISMLARAPGPELSIETSIISITVNISRNVIEDVVYDASITAGKKYDIFPLTEVAITNKSSFSAFYTLFAETKPNKSLYEEGYYRVLNSDSVFPVGTTITMIDRIENEYYYYTVNETNIVAKQQELAAQRQVSYYLHDFMKMDSTSPTNVYNDAYENTVYYHDNENYVDEEFIFIVDFANTNMTENIIDSNLELEVRAQDDQTMIPIRGYLHNKIKFSAYAGTAAQINTTGQFTDQQVYVGESTTLQLNTQYRAQQYNGTPVADTVYYDYKLGAKITVFNSDGDMLQGVDLLGVSFILNAGTTNEKKFYPQLDGTTRITLADRVSTVDSNIVIDTANSNLSNGNYTFVIESFGSYDGLYYAENTNPPLVLQLSVLNNKYGLDVQSEDVYVTRDKVTGLDENGNNEIVYEIKTSSGLANPNLRVHLERRVYGNGNEYSLQYQRVNLQDFVTDNLTVANSDRLEYQVTSDLPAKITYSIHIGENNTTGTYRLVFTVCDGDTPIGSVYQYIIIR